MRAERSPRSCACRFSGARPVRFPCAAPCDRARTSPQSLVPGGETTDAIALSPDADKLAIAVESDQEYGIEVYTLATGAVRIWMASRSTDTLLVGENTLSRTRDERTLSFPWGRRRLGREFGSAAAQPRCTRRESVARWPCRVPSAPSPAAASLRCPGCRSGSSGASPGRQAQRCGQTARSGCCAPGRWAPRSSCAVDNIIHHRRLPLRRRLCMRAGRVSGA